MDSAAYLLPSDSPAQPFPGDVESVFGPAPTTDDPGLWLGGSSDGDEGLLSHFESGGALMNSGGWSISTAPGEEGLRWNAVKTEVFDDWAGAAGGNGAKQSNTLQPPVLPGTNKTKAASAGFLGMAKQNPEEGWADLMSPSIAYASWPPSSAGGFAAAVMTPNSPPCETVQPLVPALGAGEFVSILSFCFIKLFLNFCLFWCASVLTAKGRGVGLLPSCNRWW